MQGLLADPVQGLLAARPMCVCSEHGHASQPDCTAGGVDILEEYLKRALTEKTLFTCECWSNQPFTPHTHAYARARTYTHARACTHSHTNT